jgi:hypothetical protein
MRKIQSVELNSTYFKAFVPATKAEYLVDKKPVDAGLLKDTGRGKQWGSVIDGYYTIFSEVKIIAVPIDSSYRKK